MRERERERVLYRALSECDGQVTSGAVWEAARVAVAKMSAGGCDGVVACVRATVVSCRANGSMSETWLRWWRGVLCG